MKGTLLTTFILSMTMGLMAEGYQVNIQSQRQVGMGHTGAGQKLGATSINFNPGAMVFLSEKYDFSLGASGLISTHTFRNADTGEKSESESPMGTPFYFYGAGKISERVAAGIGVTTPYGNSIKWGDDWQGRYMIQDLSLHAIFVTPTLSYKLTNNLSVGAGFIVSFGGVDLNKAINLSAINSALPDGQINLKGKTTAYGYTAGLFYQISEKISAGLSYRSKILLKLDGGDANFTVPDAVSAYFPAENKFSAELPLASNILLGLGWQVNDKWFFALDLQRVGWSAYESLDFDFENGSEALDSKSTREYENSMIYRLGASYTPSSSMILRAGIYYDETPVPDEYLTPETPGANKIGLSAGGSWYITDKLSFDASLLCIIGDKHNSSFSENGLEFKGSYKTIAWLPGIGFSYSF